jgi:hypothetical protein
MSEPDVPSHFRCPLTRRVMRDPVSALDGHTYERVAIEQWVSRNGTSPLLGTPLSVADLTPNLTLRAMISLYL